MNLPNIIGNIDQKDFFIFTACDNHYFDDFGKVLINSVLKNTNFGIHVHIFNPSPENIEFCSKSDRVSFSYEYAPLELFSNAASILSKDLTIEPNITRFNRTITAMNKGKDQSIVHRIQKTYYACARFIRLAELTQGKTKFFAMDVDAVVRKNIIALDNQYDCYLHKITGKKARVLAGGIYSTGSKASEQFLREYSSALLENITRDCIYWSMDQDVLDIVVPKYNTGDLPKTLIDWDMDSESVVWTAKGLRKDMQIFISEQKKYMF